MTASTADSVRFRQGAGRLCLDFIRTLRHRGTPDAAEELATHADLVAWVRQCGPCDAGPSPAAGGAAEAGDALLTDARELREAIYKLVAAGRSPGGVGSCSRAARELINRMAANPVPRPSLDSAARLRWRAEDPVSATLALAAQDALTLVTSPAVTRVHECANPACGALFSDSSRPGTRRWCSMGTCGNQAKKNTLRSKATHAPN